MSNPTIFLSIGIGIIMFGIGLNISFRSFKNIFIKPKAIIIGLLCQLMLLPTIAFILAYIWSLDDVYKVGLVLIAACPGGTASNLVTHMLKGRVALSVSLTAFNSFLILFTIPFILNLATELFMDESAIVNLSFVQTARDISFTVLVPVALGIVIHEAVPQLAEYFKKPLRIVLPTILLVMFSTVFFTSPNQSSTAMTDKMGLIALALLLNILTMIAGYIICRLVGIKLDGRFTIAIEMGLQNSALAIFIATSILGNQAIATIAIIYGSFSFFSTWGLAYVMKRFGKIKSQ